MLRQTCVSGPRQRSCGVTLSENPYDPPLPCYPPRCPAQAGLGPDPVCPAPRWPGSMTAADDLARACAENLWAQDNASQGLGMAIRDIAAGHAVVTMEIRPSMVNGHGLCHGGFIFTLANSAFAYACNTHNEMNLAQHCTVTFLRPARLGDTLIAEATERAREGHSGIYDVCVRSLNGEIVAEFRGHSRTLGQQFFPGDSIDVHPEN